MSRKRIYIILFILLITTAYPAEVEIPAKVQMPLFMKILSFERNLRASKESNLGILIVYQSTYRTSHNVRDEFMKAAENVISGTWEGKTVTVKSLSINDPGDLSAFIAKNHTCVIIVAPLRALDLGDISAITKKKSILSLSTLPDYVEQGYFSVGIDFKGEKPIPVINLTKAKEEGADFSSQLLKLCKVIN